MSLKVLLLQEIIASYRVPVYSIIAQNVELTIAYTKTNECQENKIFKTVKLDFKRIFGIYFIKDKFFRWCSNFDVIIFLADLHFFSFCALPFLKKNYKVIAWTIGIRASYSRRYDVLRKKDLVDWVYGRVLKESDALIFYMKEPVEFWGSLIDRNKVFVAHNTVEVLYEAIDLNEKKDRLIFIGSLYKEKKVYELIECYIKAVNMSDSNDYLMLDIVGGGPEYLRIESLINQKNIEKLIKLSGPIYDETKLARLFSRSLLCISPDQAGLSVLKSMGYGVPFVTRTNAITGGERLNIIHNVNGILYNTPEELVSVILDSFRNIDKYSIMGKNARKYYLKHATPENMATSVIAAINYVIK